MINCAADFADSLLAFLAPTTDAGRQHRSLAAVRHRPWPLTARPWLMGQTWNDLLFCHWKVDPEALAPVVPAGLPPDTREGHAWIGISPFKVSGLRPRGAPPPPVLSTFAEVNVRTYVTVGGKPGIYFLSLDTDSHSAVIAARRGYRLPYFRSRIRMVAAESGAVEFESTRTSRDGERARLAIRYRPIGAPIDSPPGSLERWLTERYCLYTFDETRRIHRAEIHHRPWRLRPASAEIDVNEMTKPFGIDLHGAPMLHFSDRQDVVLWAIAPVEPV